MRSSARRMLTGLAAALLVAGISDLPAETKGTSGPSLEFQAKGIAAEFLKDNYCQCDDSFYRAIRVGQSVVIDQFKATKSLVVKSDPVTGEDRKDGVEWKGTVVLFEFSATRQYRRSRWTEWESAPLLRTIGERLTLKRGQWEVGSGTDWRPGMGFVDQRARRNILPINCAQIAFLSETDDGLLAFLGFGEAGFLQPEAAYPSLTKSGLPEGAGSAEPTYNRATF